LKRWFAPSEAFKTPRVEVDLKVGGHYLIHMITPEGTDHIVVGKYLEIKAPEKLVYSWAWQGSPMEQSPTRVTVEFIPKGKETEVVLTHEQFSDAEIRDKHQQGWTGCLDRLQRFLG
jgi:uncharacterized protein YndB with AHSA1/START domain